MVFGYNHHTNYIKRVCVYKLYTPLFTLLFISLTGCENKKNDNTPIAIENTTEVFSQKDKKQQHEGWQHIQKKKKHTNIEKKNTYTKDILSNTFTLLNTKNIPQEISFTSDKITFHSIKEPIIIINFFSLTCVSCIEQMKILTRLQKKFSNTLSVISIPQGNSQEKTALNALIQEYNINHFVSNSKDNEPCTKSFYNTLKIDSNTTLPLIILYKEGQYYSHYEGSVPIEMIQHDIQKYIKK